MHTQRIAVFFVIFTALLVLTRHYGSLLIQTIHPLYEWMIQQIDYRFDKTLLYVDKINGENYLQLQVELSQPFWADTQHIAPTKAIYNTAGMALSNVLQPLVLILTVVLAWPAKRARDIALRSLIAIPITLLIMMLDMPFQLVNTTWQGLSQTIKLNMATTTWFNFWSDFLNGGGITAVSIASALLIVSLVNAMQKN